MTQTDPAAVVADLIGELDMRIVGIAGAPGSGKTTIARGVVEQLSERRPFQVSLDDFCYSRAEREARGLKWRAAPGSHDLDLLFSVLRDVEQGNGPITLPRYSPQLDDRVEPVVLDGPPDPLILDGWLLGYREDGYAPILEHLDLLVFLDIPTDVAKQQRFAREKRIRERGEGGFSEADIRGFWDEAIAPWIQAIQMWRDAADVVLTIDGAHRVRSLTRHP